MAKKDVVFASAMQADTRTALSTGDRRAAVLADSRGGKAAPYRKQKHAPAVREHVACRIDQFVAEEFERNFFKRALFCAHIDERRTIFKMNARWRFRMCHVVAGGETLSAFNPDGQVGANEPRTKLARQGVEQYACVEVGTTDESVERRLLAFDDDRP